MSQRHMLFPIGAKVLVSVQPKAGVTSGGIILTERSKELKPDEAAYGMALATGDKVKEVLPGFRVLCKPHMGFHYVREGMSFLVIDEKHILAVEPPEGVAA